MKTHFILHLYFLIFFMNTRSVFINITLTFLFCIFKNLPEEDEDGKTPTQPLLKKGRHFPPFCVKSFFCIVNFGFPFVLLPTLTHMRERKLSTMQC